MRPRLLARLGNLFRRQKTAASCRSRPPVAPGPDGQDRWLALVEECVGLVDELDRHGPGWDAARRELAGHMIDRLKEILERAGVAPIEGETVFDRGRHQPERPGTALPGAQIVQTLSPGFSVGRRIVRRARVRVVER